MRQNRRTMHRGVILCIVHQRTSYPGRVGRLFMERGFALDIRCAGIGQALPTSLDGYAAKVMFGGPMSANDEHLPYIMQEMRWIDTALKGAAPFVGVCLGAQILTRALGGKVWLHPQDRVEIGYTEVRPTEAGAPFFAGPLQVFQWHKEGFDLPADAALLASGGEDFPNQCYRYGDHVFGMQFHPDVTYEMMCRWTARGARRAYAGARRRDAEGRTASPASDPRPALRCLVGRLRRSGHRARRNARRLCAAGNGIGRLIPPA